MLQNDIPEDRSDADSPPTTLQRSHSSPISAFKGLIDYSREYSWLEYSIYVFYIGSLCFLFVQPFPDGSYAHALQTYVIYHLIVQFDWIVTMIWMCDNLTLNNTARWRLCAWYIMPFIATAYLHFSYIDFWDQYTDREAPEFLKTY